jgi:hypothetical protein
MKQSLAIAYSMKKKAKKMAMADGGEVGQTLGTRIGYPGSPKPKPMAQGGLVSQGMDYEEDDDATTNPGSGMNYDIPHPDDSDEPRQSDGYGDGLVDRIIQRMSEGGKVANGSMTEGLADEAPNEFDDLVLRDDLKSTNSGANDGDAIGNDQEDEDRDDIVSRTMRSWAKKDRLPNPR